MRIQRTQMRIWKSFEDQGHNVSSEVYSWLEEIAFHKECYPNLKTLTISEETQEYVNFNPWETCNWIIPRELNEKFCINGVKLRVDLKKAKIVERNIY